LPATEKGRGRSRIFSALQDHCRGRKSMHWKTRPGDILLWTQREERKRLALEVPMFFPRKGKRPKSQARGLQKKGKYCKPKTGRCSSEKLGEGGKKNNSSDAYPKGNQLRVFASPLHQIGGMGAIKREYRPAESTNEEGTPAKWASWV